MSAFAAALPLLQPPYRSGARYGLKQISQGIGTVAMVGGAGGAANSPIYACPLPVLRPVTISGLAMAIGTAVAGVSAKLALYRGNLVEGQAALVEACAGSADMGGSANTEVVLSFAAPRRLGTGLWWAAVLFNGAAQPWSMSTALTALGDFAEKIGAGSAMALTRNALAIQTMRITSANQDFTVGFPAAFGAATFGVNAPGTPFIAMVVA